MSLTFDRLREVNVKRDSESRFYNSYQPWTLSDWTNALAGEVGEACNITKKMSRMYPAGEYKLTPEQLDINMLAELSKEIADVVLYADLLASKIGVRLSDIITAKFNEVSDRIGSEVKL